MFWPLRQHISNPGGVVGGGNASLADEILVGGQGVRSDPESEGFEVYAIREITVLAKGGIRFKFHDRRAALMDLARLRGMITDKSASFHFHEDLARMSPDDQKRRVAELLEFAANLKVPGDGAVDVTPDEDEFEEG